MCKPVVVVVDDDPLIIKLMSMLLSLEGYEVIACSDAAMAYQIIHQRRPDVVTLDLMMQNDKNAGLKVLEHLRADPVTCEIPVIIVSSTADTLRGEDRRLGEFAFARLVKPIGADELFQHISSALEQRYAKVHATS